MKFPHCHEADKVIVQIISKNWSGCSMAAKWFNNNNTVACSHLNPMHIEMFSECRLGVVKGV